MRVVFSVAWALGTACVVVADAQQLEVVSVTGELEPGTGQAFSAYGLPVLNDLGQIAYWAQFGTDVGAFRHDATGPTLIVRSGDTIPPGDSVAGPFTNDVALTNDGLALVQAAVPDGGGFESVPVLADGGALSVVYRVDEPGPNAGETLVTTFRPAMNHAGQVAYPAVYAGNPANAYLFREEADGTRTTLIQHGDAAPGGGAVSIPALAPVMNNAGQVADAFGVDVGLPSQTDVLLRFDGSNTVELARTGDVVGGVSLLGFSSQSINAAGKVAFLSTGETFGTENFFIADDAGVTFLGDNTLPVIGRSDTSGLRTHHLTDTDRIVFTAEEDVPGFEVPRQGLFAMDSSGVEAIAVETEALPDGSGFFAQRGLGSNPSPAVSDNGRVAFVSRVSDTPEGSTSHSALFVYDPQDGLAEAVRTGDPLLGSTITGLFLQGNTLRSTNSPNQSTLNTGLNERGDLAFFFNLADGRTGIANWIAPLAALIGDYNGSGQVEQGDLDLVLQNWGRDTVANGIPAGWTHDLPNRLIDQGELDGVLLNWGDTAVPNLRGAAGVPEPATAYLVLIAALGLGRGRRRTRCAS